MSFKKLVILLLSIVVVALIFVLPINAATNPYGQWQTIGGVTTIRCTYYAWQQAYDRTGVALPNFGNAINWYDGARNAGYSVGTTAKPNSIAVWSTSSHSYGHVGFVVSVNGSKMTVNEGGMTNSNGQAANGNGIINGASYNNTVGQPKYSGSGTILKGFIYLTESVSSNITITSLSENNTISENNAILWGQVNKPSSLSVTKIGIRIRKDGQGYESGWSKYETPSRNYVGDSYMRPYYNLNTELGFYPTHATKYYYMFYAVVNGKEYWSSESSFTTTGSHSYGSWATTVSATCTGAGSKTRKCSCGKSETQTVSALGHSYSGAYTVDNEPTCTATGLKSKHCTRCGSKADVTTIPAKGHSFGNWKTINKPSCVSQGKDERKCSACSYIETRVVNANGHAYSNEWTIDIPADCITDGSKSKHCKNCSSKTNITVVKATGHNWGEFETIVEATQSNTGTAVRKCNNKGCKATETKTLSKLAPDGHIHIFGQWTVVTEPTCVMAGEQQKYCVSCNEKETQTLSAVGHIFGEWSEPESNGVIKRTCAMCGETEEHVTETVLSGEEGKEDEVETVYNEKEELKEDTESTEKNQKNKALLQILSVGFVLLLLIAGVIVFNIVRKKRY